MIEDQGHTCLRDDAEWVANSSEGSLAALEAFIQIDHEGQMTPFAVAALKVTVRVPGEILARLLAVEPKAFIQPCERPAVPLSRQERPGPVEQALRQFDVIHHHTLVVADILAEDETLRRRDRGIAVAERLTAFDQRG